MSVAAWLLFIHCLVLQDSEAIEVDHGTSTSPVGLLPSVASAESPTRLLARPPLIRSETKGSAAKLAAAGQTRSETIQEARGAHFNGSPNKREGVPGRVRRNASLDFDAPPERFPVVRRIHSMDFEANELLLAPSKDSAEKNDPARRLKTEDSFDSLDFRDGELRIDTLLMAQRGNRYYPHPLIVVYASAPLLCL